MKMPTICFLELANSTVIFYLTILHCNNDVFYLKAIYGLYITKY